MRKFRPLMLIVGLLALVCTATPTVHAQTPRQYGAKGDGRTDDTAALRAFLAAGHRVFDGGTYLITGGLSVTGDNITLQGNGTTLLVDSAPKLRAHVIKVTGDYCEVSGFLIKGVTHSPAALDVRGRGEIAQGIGIYGTRGKVSGNRIYNLVSVNNSRGIHCEGGGGFLVTGNIISNVNVRGTGTSGDGSAVARGIVIYNKGPASMESSVLGNHIERIKGQGAAGIALLHNDGTLPFSRGLVSVVGNVIDDCDRRYIKVQSSHVTVKGNVITDSQLDSPYAPAPAINVINSEYVTIEGNIVRTSELNNPIQIRGYEAPSRLAFNKIINNTVTMPDGANKTGIYASQCSNLQIVGNSITGGSDGIRVDATDQTVISGNVMANQLRSGWAIRTGADSTACIVTNNTDLTAIRDTSIFGIESTSSRTANNISQDS